MRFSIFYSVKTHLMKDSRSVRWRERLNSVFHPFPIILPHPSQKKATSVATTNRPFYSTLASWKQKPHPNQRRSIPTLREGYFQPQIVFLFIFAFIFSLVMYCTKHNYTRRYEKKKRKKVRPVNFANAGVRM